MDRQTEIERLNSITYHIKQYEYRLVAKMPAYMGWFGSIDKWNRQQEINQKCLEYWKRKFNRIAESIKYDKQ